MNLVEFTRPSYTRKLPSIKWRVIYIHQGKDNVVRVVTVLTAH